MIVIIDRHVLSVRKCVHAYIILCNVCVCACECVHGCVGVVCVTKSHITRCYSNDNHNILKYAIESVQLLSIVKNPFKIQFFVLFI